jgi:hypothetical protein
MKIKRWEPTTTRMYVEELSKEETMEDTKDTIDN